MTSIKHRRIGHTALTVSELGLGCASLAGVGTSVSDEDAIATLRYAIDSGISYFDSAPFYGYGRSERLVGDALRSSRESFQLSTKAGRLLKPCADPLFQDEFFPDALPMRPHFDYSYDGIMRSFEDSLQRLGLASVDILLLHDIGALTHGDESHPEIMKQAMTGGYRALSELKSQGLIQAIGLGVNECEVCLEALTHGEWDCFLLAGRYTLLEQTALYELFPACKDAGTSIIVGGPFNSGILVGGATYNYESAPSEIVDRVQAISRVCEAHDVALPAAALQFALAHPLVSSVIPGPRSPKELSAILSWYEAGVPASLWSDLKAEGLLVETDVV